MAKCSPNPGLGAAARLHPIGPSSPRGGPGVLGAGGVYWLRACPQHARRLSGLSADRTVGVRLRSWNVLSGQEQPRMDGQAPPQAVAGAGRCGRGSQLGARGCPAPAPMGPLGCGLAQVGARPAGELSMGPGPRVPVPGQAGPLWPELGVGPDLALSGWVWDLEEGSLLQGPLGLLSQEVLTPTPA